MASNISNCQLDISPELIQSQICVRIGDRQYGGWKKELLIEELSVIESKLLLCGACKGIAREAYTLNMGGVQSLRCANCLPQNLISGLDSMPAGLNRSVITEKHAMCPFVDCKWNGSLTQLEEHLGCCDELLIPCPLKCRSEGGKITAIKRVHIDEHKHNQCPQRLIECDACKDQVKATEINLHEQNCVFMLVSCPNECLDESGSGTKMLKRNELTHHKNKECPLVFVRCSYFEDGCAEMIKRKDLDQHEKSFTHKHLKLCQDNAKQQMISFMRKQENMEKEILLLKNRIGELKGSKETSFPIFGMIEMKIQDVMNKIQNKEETYSSPFFAGKYKFQVCIDWDCEQSENIACYVFLMKGDWDDTLVWPIRYRYTFIILNQNKRGDYVRTYAISEDDMKTFATSFQKPTDERNEGYGLKDFISHVECCRDRYTKDDCLTFQANLEILH